MKPNRSEALPGTSSLFHMAHLLLVEDDAEIGALLTTALRANGHDVSWQRTGGSALAHASEGGIDLVLLDLGLPDMDGVEVCRELRALLSGSVLVMLTARTDEMDVVVGLEAGADDYLTKPFGRTELLARVRAHLRRATPLSATGERSYSDGALSLDFQARRCVVDGVVVELRPKEFDLLARLARTPGEAVSRQALMVEVWDEHWYGSTKTLDVHVSALRRRLATSLERSPHEGALPMITTLRGFGYRLDPATDQAG